MTLAMGVSHGAVTGLEQRSVICPAYSVGSRKSVIPAMPARIGMAGT